MVRFVVTGFGEFSGVHSNPTEVLVNWLGQQQHHHKQQQQQQHRPCSSFTVDTCRVLEVAATAVDDFLQEQQQLVKQAAHDKRPVVLLHLGVDTQRPGLNLECQAFNNATFRCPDQQGWQPNAALIEAGPGMDVHCVRQTSLPLQQLVQELQAAGFDSVRVSHDAGRFVCNYTFYKSMATAAQLSGQPCSGGTEAPGSSSHSSSSSSGSGGGGGGGGGNNSSDGAAACYSLFVHVPPFEVISEERQKEFVLQLLQCIARCLQEEQ